MSGHLTVHYLDLVRHGLAFTWTWTTWIGNVSAGIVIFFVVSLFWPRLRHAIERATKRHFDNLKTEIHAKLDQQHEEKMKQAQDHHDEHIALVKKNHESPTTKTKGLGSTIGSEPRSRK